MINCKFLITCTKCNESTELGGINCDGIYTKGNICINAVINNSNNQNYIIFKCNRCGNECRIKNRVIVKN